MGLFDKIFKKKTEPVQPAPPAPKQEQQVEPEIKITVAVKREQERAASVCELSRLDFGKPTGALGCFLNYEPRVLYEPSERQLAYLKDLGVLIPDGVTNIDASCMISRATGEDDLKSPGPELVALAAGLGVEFSAFVGARGLIGCIYNQSGDRERAALYAYAVRQSTKGSAFGNMLEDPERGVFYNFADKVLADPALLRSLQGRDAADLQHPHKGTAIYKAAAAHFAGGGA